MSTAGFIPISLPPPRASAQAFRCRRASRPRTPPAVSTTGVHGTTFGGNPLAMAVGNATLDVILAPGFLERVARLGLDMRQRLASSRIATTG